MNLTIFIGSLGVGGTERVACNLANYMDGRGHKVEILTMSDENPAYFLEPNVLWVPLLKASEHKGYIHDNMLRLRRLCRYFRQTHSDCCCSMNTDGLLILSAIRYMIKIPIIVTERADPDHYPSWKKFLHRRAASCASGFVFQTPDAQEWYSRYIEGIPVRVIPNAVNPDMEFEAHKGPRQKVIVTAARFVDEKNIPLLLHAFAKICASWPEYSLILYGDGYLRKQLEQEAQELGIASRVCFPGFTNNVASKIKSASLFVLSSDVEGMPNTLIEAMALGLPCISTDCRGGGARYLIQNGHNGILVPTRDADALARAIDAILRDFALAEKLGNHAAMIKDRLSSQRVYHEWETFFLEICSKN